MVSFDSPKQRLKRTLKTPFIIIAGLLAMLMIASPASLFAQQSSLELQFKGGLNTLFGSTLDGLPEGFKAGYAGDGTLIYNTPKIGLGLQFGYWRNNYEPTGSGVTANATYTTRLDHIAAHYLMFGPRFYFGSDKSRFTIYPKGGIQRFYFPHLRSTVPNGSTSIQAERVRTDFDVGTSLGLELQFSSKISELLSIGAFAEYNTTVGPDAFRFIATNNLNNTTINSTDPFQRITFGATIGLDLDVGAKKDASQNTLKPGALDIGVGGGLNFLGGSGLDNLPGTLSAGYNTEVTANYRIGLSGVSVRGGFWDNQYDASQNNVVVSGVNTTMTQRLDNLSAHYVTVGPIVPITGKNATKVRAEFLPNVGLQRFYFPHSRLTGTAGNTTRVIQQVRTRLGDGWSAGAGLNVLFQVAEKFDLKVSGDYMTTLTRRGFAFSRSSIEEPVINSNNLATSNLTTFHNRDRVNRISANIGLVYNLYKRPASDKNMSPEEIQGIIEGKDDEEKDMSDESMDKEMSGENMNKDETTDPSDNVEDPNAPVTTETIEVDENGNIITTKTTTTTITTTTSDTTLAEQPIETIEEPNISDAEVAPDPNEPVTSEPTTTSEEEDSYVPPTVYRVQFVALSKDIKVFNELKQYGTVILEYFSEQGLYRYMVGDSLTEEEGLDLLQTIRKDGWPKAFLVKYQGGVRTRVR